MRISHLNIEGYRGLRNVNIQQLDPHVNLFVGINGAGKSSILDAMALVFSWFTARMVSSKGRGRDIPKDDIRKHAPNGCTIELIFEDGGSWKLYRSLKSHKSDKSDLSDLNQLVSELKQEVEENKSASLPVVAYYNVNRIIPNVYPRLPRTQNESTQFDTYKNALKGGHLFSDFFTWFRLSEDYENERYKEDATFRDSGLNAVRLSMESIFPEYSDMKVSRRPLALVMKKGEDIFKINQLSDGEKCYIALVCDIARRLAIANPSNENPLTGTGVVMIDELDLHLHPKWQQSVVSNLTETFPNCQFFITTHSPIVASDTSGKIFGIKNGEAYPEKAYGRLASNILSSVFDLSMARSLYVQSLIDSAYKAIHENDGNTYDSLISRLSEILGADDIEIAGMRIEKLRWDKANENHK